MTNQGATQDAVDSGLVFLIAVAEKKQHCLRLGTAGWLELEDIIRALSDALHKIRKYR